MVGLGEHFFSEDHNVRPHSMGGHGLMQGKRSAMEGTGRKIANVRKWRWSVRVHLIADAKEIVKDLVFFSGLARLGEVAIFDFDVVHDILNFAVHLSYFEKMREGFSYIPCRGASNNY